MRRLKKFMLGVLIALFIWAYAGCDTKDPLQRAGGKIDQTIEKSAETIEAEGSKETPAQRVGRKVDQLMEDAKQKVDKAVLDIDKQ
ncbi:MAG: hypothetical protein JW920_01195 [Deltaproteobacteria bacterium]|nr:hypothetical protein [Deltaproteobacteria bacterium]